MAVAPYSMASSTCRSLLVTLPALAVTTTQFSHRCSASSKIQAPLWVPYSQELSTTSPGRIPCMYSARAVSTAPTSRSHCV
jgi:hypothetical protein